MTTTAMETLIAVEEEAIVPEILIENAIESGLDPFLVEMMRRIEMKPTFANERGLLYSFRPKVRLEPGEYGDTEKNQEFEVLIKPETITFRDIIHTTGYNHKSKKENKTYHNWKVLRAISLSLKYEKHGHRVLRIYEHIARTRKFRGCFTNATARLIQDYQPTSQPDIKFRPEKVQNEYAVRGYNSSPPPLAKQAELMVRWAFAQLLQKLDPTNPAFKAKEVAHSFAYPMLQLFPNSNFNIPVIRAALPKNLSLQEEPDAKKFISKVLGKEGARKDMVKAVVATTDINSLFLAAQLKELFPLDWLRDLVKSPNDHVIFNATVIYTAENVAGLIDLLEPLTLPQRKRLLVEKNTGPAGYANRQIVSDSIRMIAQFNPEQKEEYKPRLDYSSWRKLHDSLIEITNEIRNDQRSMTGNKRIEWDEKSYMTRLHNTRYTFEGEVFTLSAPETRNQLDKWGNELHNCIASYHQRVITGSTNLFGVYSKDGTLFGNIEISNTGRIHQYMNKYNRRAPEGHWEALRALQAEEAEEFKEKQILEAKERAKQERIASAMKRHRAVAA